VPTAWVIMEKFPLNNSGKVDRKKLPPPDYSNKGDEVKSAAPSRPVTPLEKELQGLFAKVLMMEPDRIVVDRSFADFGERRPGALSVSVSPRSSPR
jgi:hypothetical protein